jgi:AcrR family transcriptional regulator
VYRVTREGSTSSGFSSFVPGAGAEATTIQAVADRAGVARATIYLRWPGRHALITAAIRHAIGRSPYRLTGDLETDIAFGGEQTRAILSGTVVRDDRPGAHARAPSRRRGGGRSHIRSSVPEPRARRRGIRSVRGRASFRTDVAADGIVDLVTGPLLMRLMATAQPPSREFTREVVMLVVGALCAQPETR